MDDPSLAVLIAVENPKNTIQYGGVVVAPMVKEVLTEGFSILNIEKRLNGVPFNPRLWIDKKIYTVKDYIGLPINKIKNEINYQFIIYGNGNTVKMQIPEAGEKIQEGGYVAIYT